MLDLMEKPLNLPTALKLVLSPIFLYLHFNLLPMLPAGTRLKPSLRSLRCGGVVNWACRNIAPGITVLQMKRKRGLSR